jgi:UDP-N-acetylglucosamine 2-epimerase (non-hydrolysing)/GDP/UDP-N,N'-diacetylbacillosamine 2-epimerase (hydrolysing)
MSVKKHICFFTGKRGGFNHLIPILELISKRTELSYSIIAADMHLSTFFGETINEVSNWANNIYQVETLMSSDSKLARAKSIGIGIMGISEVLSQIKPDLAFLLGDRGEVLAMGICALEMNIPIVHLFGGDVCQGGVDEPVRHAITKLANIHLASNQQSADRILKMGEEPWRIHNVGSPVLDLIKQKRFTEPKTIKEKFDLDLQKPIFMLLQHSVTWQVEEAEHQMHQTMEAIDYFGHQTIAIYPCSDPGYEAIIRVLTEYQNRPYFHLYKNIEFQDFWGLMNVASLFINNSSAGVMETPSFKIPAINLGIRQHGRLRANNVIDADHNKDQIVEAIQTSLYDENFKAKLKNCVSPYGDGKASERIVSILKNLELTDDLIRKKMTF